MFLQRGRTAPYTCKTSDIIALLVKNNDFMQEYIPVKGILF
jgi:hypothetical protein